MDAYDLIIIGLGPAGCFAAKSASIEGLSVLAIDKREQVGYPVDCGEFYPATTEMPSLMPNVEDYSLLEIPDKFITNNIIVKHFLKKLVISFSPKFYK